MNETNLDALTMESVRAMDDHTLRRLVAGMLGWRIEHETHEFAGMILYRESFIVRPDGSKFKAYVIDEYHEQELVCVIPDWPDSLDDAVSLLVGQRMELQSSGADWAARVGYWPGADGWQRADTPARAVTLAWVAWKLEQGR